MSTVLAENDEFQGNINNAIRQITVPAAGAGTIEKRSVAPDGTVSWVAVPDGGLTGPTNVTMYAPPGAIYRVTGVTGYVELD